MVPNCTHPNRLTPLPTNFGISAFGGFGLAFGRFTFRWAVSLPTVSHLAQAPSCDPAKITRPTRGPQASMAFGSLFSRGEQLSRRSWPSLSSARPWICSEPIGPTPGKVSKIGPHHFSFGMYVGYHIRIGPVKSLWCQIWPDIAEIESRCISRDLEVKFT